MGQLCPKCQQAYNDQAVACTVDGSPLVADLRGHIINERYHLDHPIGLGGMGAAVWSARQEPGGRIVAVKLLTNAEAKRHEAFTRECGIAARFNHRHITTVHDFGHIEDGTTFIVMELLEGQTLCALLKHGALPIPRVLHIVTQLLRGIEHAHEKGIVHRDLKPDNIFLVRQDETEDFVKILDFGIAEVKQDCHPDENQMTREGPFCGTPAYMAPEQISGDHVDESADIYTVGVLMYQMATGELPFKGSSSYEILKKHMLDQSPSILQTHPELKVPKEFDQVVRCAMAKSSNERYQSAREMRMSLRVLRRSMGMITQDTEELPLQDVLNEMNMARSKWPLRVGFFALILLAMGGWWGMRLMQAPHVEKVAPGAISPTSVASAESPATTWVVVDSTPTGAMLELDGEQMGKTPARLHLSAGTYSILVRSPRHESKTAKLIVDATMFGEEHKRMIRLIPRASARRKPATRTHKGTRRNAQAPKAAPPETPDEPPAQIELLGGGNHVVSKKRRRLGERNKRKPVPDVQVLE